MNITEEILTLSQELVKIPSVTVGGPIRFDEINRCADLIESCSGGFKSRGREIRSRGLSCSSDWVPGGNPRSGYACGTF